jgi:hypothetical protein
MRTQILINSFLFSAFLQGAAPSGVIWDFNAAPVSSLPSGWKARGGEGQPTYRIKADAGGNRYLAALSQGSDVQLGTEVQIKTEETPILTWRWRVGELPRGGNERNLKTLDSAASVYAVFGSRLLPRIVKYVWSTSLPAGSSFKHPNSGRMAIIVVNTGADSLNQWLTVSRNLVDDYKKAFGSNPGNLIAIGVKTDSDSTRSTAQADYDDIRLTR